MPFAGPAEDRLALRDLLDAYADAVTRRDADAWAATWAEDGEWTLPDASGPRTTRGREAIRAHWVEAMKAFPGILFEAWPGAIAVEGDRAEMRSYTRETFDQGGETLCYRGAYEDRCVRVEGAWRFQSRSFRILHIQRTPKAG